MNGFKFRSICPKSTASTLIGVAVPKPLSSTPRLFPVAQLHLAVRTEATDINLQRPNAAICVHTVALTHFDSDVIVNITRAALVVAGFKRKGRDTNAGIGVCPHSCTLLADLRIPSYEILHGDAVVGGNLIAGVSFADVMEFDTIANHSWLRGLWRGNIVLGRLSRRWRGRGR